MEKKELLLGNEAIAGAVVFPDSSPVFSATPNLIAGRLFSFFWTLFLRKIGPD